jgi:hypothetical protein
MPWNFEKSHEKVAPWEMEMSTWPIARDVISAWQGMAVRGIASILRLEDVQECHAPDAGAGFRMVSAR